MKHLLLATGVFATVSFSGISFAARDIRPTQHDNTQIHRFFMHPRNSTKHKIPTKEQFTQMHTRAQQQLKIENAIANNDYTAFILATTQETSEKNITQEQFNQIVKYYEQKKQIDTTIRNRDYTGFVATITSIDNTKRKKDTLIPTMNKFEKMVNMISKRDAIQQAILTGDYTTFIQIWEEQKKTFKQDIVFEKIERKHRKNTGLHNHIGTSA